MKEIKGLKLNNDGMTMVEVLMGFLILSIILGGIVTLISFSSKMYFNSVDLRRSQTDITSDAYKIGTNGNKTVVSTTSGYVVINASPGAEPTPVTLNSGESVGYKDMQLYKVEKNVNETDTVEAYVFVSTVTPTVAPTPTTAP